MPSVTFTITNLPGPPDCPGAKPNFCGNLGDSNLGDDYPHSEGWAFQHPDGKVTKFVFNKNKLTVFLLHRDTAIGIDAEGNLFICGNGDIKVMANGGGLELMARDDITIQSDEGKVNIVALEDVKICSAEKGVTVLAPKAIQMQSKEEGLFVTTADDIMITSEDGNVILTAENNPEKLVILNSTS